MLSEVWKASERQELESILQSYGASSMKTIEIVSSWMHNKIGFPVHVRIVSWWGMGQNIRC